MMIVDDDDAAAHAALTPSDVKGSHNRTSLSVAQAQP